MSGRVALIGCGAAKLAGQHPARDLYTGPLFTAARRDVEARGLRWWVLSALYGIVPPHHEIDSYDLRIEDRKAQQLCECAGRACRTANGWCYKRGYISGVDVRLRTWLAGAVVEVHAGAGYVELLRSTLAVQEGRVSLVEPCAGLTQGRRLQFYSQRRQTGVGQLALFTAAA